MKTRYKIVGHYVYSDLESRDTLATKAEAQAENRKWTNDAQKQHMRWKGRVVPVKEATNSPCAVRPGRA